MEKKKKTISKGKKTRPKFQSNSFPKLSKFVAISKKKKKKKFSNFAYIPIDTKIKDCQSNRPAG